MNNKVWYTAECIPILYKDLKDDHLLNILKWIEKNSILGMTIQDGGGGLWDVDDIWFDEYEIKGKQVEKRFDYNGLLHECKKRNLSRTKWNKTLLKMN